jgi:hypothetical protein
VTIEAEIVKPPVTAPCAPPKAAPRRGPIVVQVQ